MNLTRVVRISLWITGPANLLAAYAFAFPSSAIGILLELPQQSSLLYTLFAGVFVGMFGLAYIWLATQPTFNKPLLLFSAAGKTMAVLIALVTYALGNLSGVTSLVISGDMLFAGLWFFWLLRNNG